MFAESSKRRLTRYRGIWLYYILLGIYMYKCTSWLHVLSAWLVMSFEGYINKS